MEEFHRIVRVLEDKVVFGANNLSPKYYFYWQNASGFKRIDNVKQFGFPQSGQNGIRRPRRIVTNKGKLKTGLKIVLLVNGVHSV